MVIRAKRKQSTVVKRVSRRSLCGGCNDLRFLLNTSGMVPRNTSVVVQNMFSITPKPLSAVNVVLSSFIDKLLGVINHQMLTKALQRLIASKGIRIANRALAGMVLDKGHEGVCAKTNSTILYRPCHPAPTGQKRFFCL